MSEYCNEEVELSFRIHGGYGCSKEYEIERLYREETFMLIGEAARTSRRWSSAAAVLKDYKLKG